MRFGPLSLNRRRTLRGAAGFVVALLLTGQAMAVTGCCWNAPSILSSDEASSAPACPDHASGADSGIDGKPACPADQPSPQARAVDLPSTQPIVAIVAVVWLVADVGQAPPPALTVTAIPPPPLYARLQRLRL